ncbi:MAG: hypothetical protein NXI24_00960 [bacterium]|nr:hypothetical protein [bacterium]
MSKFAPRRLDVLLDSGRLFANGETILLAKDADRSEARTGAGSSSAGQPGIRLELKMLSAAMKSKGLSSPSSDVRAPRSRMRVRIFYASAKSPARVFDTRSLIVDADESYRILLPGSFDGNHGAQPGTARVAARSADSSVSNSGREGLSRTYRGRLEIFAELSLAAVVHTPLQRYVQATARAELGPLLASTGPTRLEQSARAELLSAMETVVRSYALAHRDRHTDHADLCDLTHCMHFPGLLRGERSKPKSESGPRMVLIFKDAARVSGAALAPRDFVPAYFHSTCGGRLVAPQEYWPGTKRPELVGVFREGRDDLKNNNDSPLCSASPHYRWQTRVAHEDLRSILTHSQSQSLSRSLSPGPNAPSHASGRPGVGILDPMRRVGGRVVAIRVGRENELAASDFLSHAGRVLGWNAIKSSDFIVEGLPDRSWNFRGRGLGHGVGFCQWGAREQARLGRSARKILEFYYPGARIARLAGGAQ